MNNPLVSVIIPVYNVEKDLRRCVDSILSQTYKNTEIILVDDGSKDNSGKICDEYKSKYENIKVIHKSNGGLSSARNAGLKVMTGEYVTFVDSDDWIEEQAIDVYVSAAMKEHSDLVISNYYVYDGQKHVALIKNEINPNDFIENALLEKIHTSAWAKLIHSSLLTCPSEIRYEVGRRYEDAIPSFLFIQRAKKPIYVDESLYIYVQSSSSIVYNPKSSDIDDLIHNVNELSKILVEYEDNQMVYAYLISTLVYALQLWYRVDDNNTEQFEEIKKLLTQYRKIMSWNTIVKSNKWKKLLLVKLGVSLKVVKMLEERRKK